MVENFAKVNKRSCPFISHQKVYVIVREFILFKPHRRPYEINYVTNFRLLRFTTVMKDISCRWVLQPGVDYRNYTPSEGMHFGLPMQCNYVFDTQYKAMG